MQSQLVTGIVVASVLLALVGGLTTLTRRDVGSAMLLLAALVEVAVLVQAVLAVVRLVSGHRVDGIALFVAYLLFSLVVMPLGTLWAVGERNRWSGMVVAVAALALVVTLVRMDTVWLGPVG